MVTRQLNPLRPCNKKALFIANKFEFSGNLELLKATYKIRYHYSDSKILITPNKQEIIEAFENLLADLQKGDTFVIHICSDGDEQGLFQKNYETDGKITRDFLNEHLIDLIPQQVGVFLTIDCNKFNSFGLRYNLMRKTEVIENVSVAETWGNIVILFANTLAFENLLDSYYMNNLSLKKIVELLDCKFEFGKAIDDLTPLGRIICAPI